LPNLESVFSEMTSSMDRCGQAISEMQERRWMDKISTDVVIDTTSQMDVDVGQENEHARFVEVVALVCAYERELSVKRRIVLDLQTCPPTDSEVLTNYCTVLRVQPHLPLVV
jgi:hypothetical protein